MALRYNLTGDILGVTEYTHSFFETKVFHIYYDIKNWKQSLSGKKDAPIVLDMDEASIEWVRKHYLPKVGLN